MRFSASGKTSHQVIALGITQTIAWASSTYLPAILAAPIAADLGVGKSTVFGAFSLSLVVMALAGPAAGRAIDLHGGRRVLAISNLVLAGGLILLGASTNVALLMIAWCVLGAGMALGLYDAAFATLVRLHGMGARAPITGITLIAGFASTVGWPLSAFLSAHFGWRACCLSWAAIHILLALPINLLVIPKEQRRPTERRDKALGAAAAVSAPAPAPAPVGTSILLAMFFASTAFVTSAMAAHLPGLLVATGVTTAIAVTAGALLGPAQVAARIAEFGIAQRFSIHPLITARIATALHPVGVALIALQFGTPVGAFGFAMLHGAGNGMITIAKGTLPLALFGPTGYGERTGLLSVVARGMQALAPLAFGLILDAWGARGALTVSAALSLIALGTLLALRSGADASGAG
ncbi:MAG: MFS transporter [Betaproteobacteria bacterium]|nr:MFS transporter [Betaproteobacteria bacterium]